MKTKKPTRPALRYHGGKWRLAPWLIEHFPPHRVYMEPFGGAASVLLRKPRSYGEIYNDLDGEVVNFFQILRDPKSAAELRRRCERTPFARTEFKGAYAAPTDSIDRAHKMVIRAFMGFGSASMTRTHVTGFRANTNRNGTIPAEDWRTWPEQIPLFVERLRGVVIENRAAVEVIATHDRPDCLIYADPPYPWGTRSSLKDRGRVGVKHAYRMEMSDADHSELAEALHKARGMVIISGYPCDLYDRELYAGWRRIERPHMADGARPRTEVIWMNRAASTALDRARSQIPLDLRQEPAA